MLLLPFLYLYLIKVASQRWDYITTVHNSGGQSSGSWQSDQMCPSGTWARGYQHCTDLTTGLFNDDTGTNVVRFFCYDYSGAHIATINSNPEKWGTWSSVQICDGNENFIIGYQLKVFDASVAVAAVQITCSDHYTKNAGTEYPDGTWKQWGYCPAGTAVCGQKSRWESDQGAGDDTTLNDLQVYCCRVCDEKNARYVNPTTLNCDECHYTCKTCSGGGSSQCNSCYHSDTLSSNSCPGPSCKYFFPSIYESKSKLDLYQVTYENPPSGWAGAVTSNCGIFTNIVGGYNNFGKDQSITKLFSDLPPFFKKRVRVRYIKIDSWDAEAAMLDINGVNLISTTIQWNDGFLFGNQCGLGDYNEYAVMLELETSTDKNVVTFPIKIYSGLNSVPNDEWWGVSDFYLGVLKCDVTCKTCTGPNANQCDGCYPNASLQPDNTCACDDTYFAVSTSPCTSYPCTTCKPCHIGCKKCSGELVTDCSSCIADYYFLLNRCYFKNCPSPKCGNNATLTCDDTCNAINQYIDATDRLCKLCDSTCKTCSEKQYTNCLSCSDPRFHSDGSGDGECITNCLIPRFAHEPTRICQVPCPAPTWGWESDRKCKDNCLSTQYKETSNRICTACESTCETCKGPTSGDCLSCSAPRYLYGSKCLTDCLVGKYGKSSTHTCENCDSASHCKTCETPDQPTKCLSCEVPYYLKSNACVLSCSTNEYEDDLNRKCEACHPSCATCFNGLATNCLSCSGTSLFYEVDNTCITACPSPYYATSNLCLKTCASPLFGKNTTRACESTPCPTDEYADPSDRICRKCHTECLTCSGLSNTDCQTCGDPRYKKATSCVLSCGDGFYGKKVPSLNTCEACTSNCMTCVTPDGPSTCSTCGVILGVPYFLSGTSCVTLCPEPTWGRNDSFKCEASCLSTHHYGDICDRICKECSSLCLTCDENGCLTCPAGRFLYQKSCDLKCPADLGYWPDGTTNTCEICHSTCQTCSKSGADSCLSCLYPAYLQNSYCVKLCDKEPKILYGDPVLGKCVEECQPGYYPDRESQTCMRCHSSCLTCDKGSSQGCKSCQPPLSLTPDKGTCEVLCPFHYFREKLKSGLLSPNCTICDETCGNCETVKEKCLSCAQGLFPYYSANWLCVPCSMNQQYLDPGDKICKICNVAYCKKCKTMELCEECLDEYYVEHSGDKDFCLPKTVVTATLEAVVNPKLFKFKFSEEWVELFENIKQRTAITIDSLAATNYQYVIYTEAEKNTFFIQFTFFTNVTEKSKLHLVINGTFKTEASKYYNLSTPVLDAFLLGYVPCEALKYWSWETKSCVKALALTPRLSVGIDPQDVALAFDFDCPSKLLNDLEHNTKITIPELSETFSHDFIFTVGDYRNLKIALQYGGRFSNNPTLFLEFKLTSALSQDDSFYFTTNPINVTLPKYYDLNENEKQRLKSVSGTSKTGTQVARVVMIMQTLLNVGSSFAVKSMVLMDLLRFLRFVNISYPVNAKEIFVMDFKPPDVFEIINIIPKLNIPEDPRDRQPGGLFDQYGISAYLVNNHGSFLFNCVFFTIVGILVNFFNSFFVAVDNRLFQIILKVLSNVFVWNYILTFYLSSHQTSLLYVAVSLDYYSLESDKGVANLAITSVFAAVMVLMPIIFYKKLNKFAEIKSADEVDAQLKIAQLNSRAPSRFSLFFLERDATKKRMSALAAEAEHAKSKESIATLNDNPLLDREGLPVRKGSYDEIQSSNNLQSNVLIDDKLDFDTDEAKGPLYSNRNKELNSPGKAAEKTTVDLAEKRQNINKEETADTLILERKGSVINNDKGLQDDLSEKAQYTKKRSSFVNLWEMLRKKKPEKPLPRGSKSERKSLKSSESKEIKKLQSIAAEKDIKPAENANTEPVPVIENLDSHAEQNPAAEPKHPEVKAEANPVILEEQKEQAASEEKGGVPEKQEEAKAEEKPAESTEKTEVPSPQISRKKKGHMTRLIENVMGDEDYEEQEPITVKNSQLEGEKKEAEGSKFGRKSMGKIVPWDEPLISMKKVQTVDFEKGSTKFGRKSKGKITPWDEISGSFSYATKSFFQHINRPLSKTEYNSRYQALNKDFVFDSGFKRNFLLLDILRQFIIVCSIVFLPEWPLTTVSIITSVNAFMILLLFVIRPYKSLVTLLQVFFNELCLLTGCASALYLALLDKKNDMNYDSRLLAGWFIVYANLILIYFFISMIFLQFFADIRGAIVTVMHQYKNKYRSVLAINSYKNKRLQMTNAKSGGGNA